MCVLSQPPGPFFVGRADQPAANAIVPQGRREDGGTLVCLPLRRTVREIGIEIEHPTVRIRRRNAQLAIVQLKSDIPGRLGKVGPQDQDGAVLGAEQGDAGVIAVSGKGVCSAQVVCKVQVDLTV